MRIPIQAKKILRISLAIVAALLLTICPALAAQGDWVTADGAGSNKSEALHDAQRNAVQLVLGTMLSSETLVENFILVKDKILSQVTGYVKKVEILQQSCQDDICTTQIRAIVEEISLADDVAALVHVLPRLNYPTLAVSFSQQNLTDTLNNVSIDLATIEQVIVHHLSDKGFSVVDSTALTAEKKRQSALMGMSGDSFGQALEAASHLAQIMISGQAVAQDFGASPYNKRLHAYGAMLTAKVYETTSGKLLASSQAEAKNVHHSFATGTQKAMQQAGKKLVNDLSAQIIQSWLDACYNDHDVQLIVEKISFSGLKKLTEQLDRVKGLNRVNRRSFLRGRAELVIGWSNCNTIRLAELLEEANLKGGRLEILEVQGNTLRAAYTQ